MLSDVTITLKARLLNSGLNAPYGARCFLTREVARDHNRQRPSLNAPYGARCFLTRQGPRVKRWTTSGLNAPYGARCFLTARRVAPTVTSRNATPDRQGPRKHPPDPQTHGQNSRVFVANPHIATNAPRSRTRPGKADRHRRVAASNCALHNALTTEHHTDRRTSALTA